MANSHQIISIFVWAVALSASWHQIEAIGQVTISPEAINNKLTAIIDEQYVMTCTSSGNDEDKPKALQWRTSRGTLFTDDKFQRIYTQLMGDSLLLFFSRVTKEDSTVYLCSYMQDGQQKELGVELVLRSKTTKKRKKFKKSMKKIFYCEFKRELHFWTHRQLNQFALEISISLLFAKLKPFPDQKFRG